MGQGPEVEWVRPARLLRSLGHAVIATELTGRIVDWNPAAGRLYGWAAEEVLGRDVQDVIVPQAGRDRAGEIMAALRAGRPWSGAFRVRRKDGSTFMALVTNAGVLDDDGALVGIVGVSADLGAPLRALMARSSDGAIALDRNATITFISPSTVELFDWTESRAVGRPLWDLIHPDDRAAAIAQFREMTAGAVRRMPPLEYRLRCGNDDTEESYRWVEVVMSNLLDDPAVLGVVGNIRDVTDRREDRDHLARLTEQLQQALSTRVVIEQAKGMVAAQHGIGVEEAFGVLRRHARDHNASLQAVATAVVSLGLRP